MTVTPKPSSALLPAAELWLNVIEQASVTDSIIWTRACQQFFSIGKIPAFQRKIEKELFFRAHPLVKTYAHAVFSASDTSSLMTKLKRVFEYQIQIMIKFSSVDSQVFLGSFSLRDRITPEFYAKCNEWFHEQHLLFFGLGHLIPNRQIPQAFQNTSVIEAKSSSLYEIPVELFSPLLAAEVLNLEHNNISRFALQILTVPNLRHVNLSRNDIREIEDFSDELEETSLEELNLSVNCLETFPSSLTRAPLTALHLGQNRITEIPSDIEGMRFLRKLDVTTNQLVVISSKIASLSLLETLNLSHNPNLTRIPDLTGLNRLVYLDISYTGIFSLPKGIETLPFLEKIEASNNKIRKIPSSLSTAKALKTLNLSDNEISEIPEGINEMRSLTELRLSRNKISTLPESMKQMNLLEKLYVYGNPLSLSRDSVTSFPFRIFFKFKDEAEKNERSSFVEKTKVPFWNLGIDTLNRLLS